MITGHLQANKMSFSEVLEIPAAHGGTTPPSPTAKQNAFPSLPTPTSVAATSSGGSRRKSKVAEMQQYLKDLEKSHGEVRKLVEEAKGPPIQVRKTPSRRRSTHNYDNANLAVTAKISPSHKMWVESLERMRDKQSSLKQPVTPATIRNDEHHRLAKRLATLDFPMDACLEALEKADMNIEKSVNMLLKWYPKGEGGRSAVMKLLKVLVGAEKKLDSMRGKLTSLYHPESGMGTPKTAAKSIFRQFDHDNSGFIDADEFSGLLKGIGVIMTEDECREAINMLDEDGNGQIEEEEFVHWWLNHSSAKTESMPVNSVFDHVEKEGRKLLNAEHSTLYLYDANSSNVWTRRGHVGSALALVPPGHSLAHTVVLTGKVMNIIDPTNDKRMNSDRYANVKNVVIAPVTSGSRGSREIIGAIEVTNKLWGTPFAEPDIARLQKFCSQTKMGVEKCLRKLTTTSSPVRSRNTKHAPLAAIQGYSSPFASPGPTDRRQTFNMYHELGSLKQNNLLPSTMSKIANLLDEHEEGTESAAFARSRPLNSIGKTKTTGLSSITESAAGAPSNKGKQDDWMSRLRDIENKR